MSLQWRHNGRDSVSNHQPHDCFLNRSFRHRSKKTSKLRVTGLCAGNSPETGEFPAQMASNAKNVSIWWRHHVIVDPRVFAIQLLGYRLFPYSEPGTWFNWKTSACQFGFKDRAHLSTFKIFIFEKFSCFIVLVVFLVIVQSSELVSVWFCEKMTFFPIFFLVTTSLRYMWAGLPWGCRPLAG